jgi:hypothetical protein
MPKFYSQKAYEEMVTQYIANGFEPSAAVALVNHEERIAMQEFAEFSEFIDEQAGRELDAEEWMNILDPTSYYSGDVE